MEKIMIPAGMVAWEGGEFPPTDWDGGEVIWRYPSGRTFQRIVTADDDWRHTNIPTYANIIAYTPSRDEIGRLREAGQEDVSDAVHAALWKADAEVARLRDVLEQIARIPRSAYEAARIARAALATKGSAS